MSLNIWFTKRDNSDEVISIDDIVEENVAVCHAIIGASWGWGVDIKVTPTENKKQVWETVRRINYEIQNCKGLILDCSNIGGSVSECLRIFPDETQTINRIKFKCISLKDGTTKLKKKKIKILNLK